MPYSRPLLVVRFKHGSVYTAILTAPERPPAPPSPQRREGRWLSPGACFFRFLLSLPRFSTGLTAAAERAGAGLRGAGPAAALGIAGSSHRLQRPSQELSGHLPRNRSQRRKLLSPSRGQRDEMIQSVAPGLFLPVSKRFISHFKKKSCVNSGPSDF